MIQGAAKQVFKNGATAAFTMKISSELTMGSGGWGGLGWGELGRQSFAAWGCVGVYGLGVAFFAFSLDVYCIG